MEQELTTLPVEEALVPDEEQAVVSAAGVGELGGRSGREATSLSERWKKMDRSCVVVTLVAILCAVALIVVIVVETSRMDDDDGVYGLLDDSECLSFCNCTNTPFLHCPEPVDCPEIVAMMTPEPCPQATPLPATPQPVPMCTVSQCGEEDTDGDGVGDLCDECPSDPAKVAPGQCGCSNADLDSDGDGVADCMDACPYDGEKVSPGQCGCGERDDDRDGDNVSDCIDDCPLDPNKVRPGVCGCGVEDIDTDGDLVLDCLDQCPNDPDKREWARLFVKSVTITRHQATPGANGCGNAEASECDNPVVCNCTEDPEETGSPSTHPDVLIISKAEDAMIYNSIMEWKVVFEEAFSGSFVPSTDMDSIDRQYWENCWADPDWFRMHGDYTCTMLWMRQIANQHPVGASEILAVVTKEEEDSGVLVEKNQQNGGVHLHMDGGAEGYFKMCYGNTGSSETFLMELVAFQVDRLLGFYRTPVVVPYYMEKQVLDEFALALESADPETILDEYDRPTHNAETIVRHCGTPDGNGVEGALVGWSNFPLKYIHHTNYGYAIRFGDLNEEEVNQLLSSEFNISQSSSYEEKKHVLENVALNMWGMITGFLGRFGHNVFVVQTFDRTADGPFIFIDNDRASWRHTAASHYTEMNSHNPIRTFCKFPKSIAKRILFLTSSRRELRLSTIVNQTTALIGDHGVLQMGYLWSDEYSANMDENMHYVGEAIRHCLRHHEEDEVLIEEPWSRPYDFHQQNINNFRNYVSRRDSGG